MSLCFFLQGPEHRTYRSENLQVDSSAWSQQSYQEWINDSIPPRVKAVNYMFYASICIQVGHISTISAFFIICITVALLSFFHWFEMPTFESITTAIFTEWSAASILSKQFRQREAHLAYQLQPCLPTHTNLVDEPTFPTGSFRMLFSSEPR